MKKKIIFFHHAGGSQSSYDYLKSGLKDNYDFVGFDLDGRGNKIDRPFNSDLDYINSEIESEIKDIIYDESDYIILGHSMGAIIAFDFCFRRFKRRKKLPEKLIIAAQGVPENISGNKWYKLSDKELVENISNIDGSTSFEKKLIEIYIDKIRSDVKIVETYEFPDENIKIPIDLGLIIGLKDKITKIENVYKWKSFFSGEVISRELDCGHFFKGHEKDFITAFREIVEFCD